MTASPNAFPALPAGPRQLVRAARHPDGAVPLAGRGCAAHGCLRRRRRPGGADGARRCCSCRWAAWSPTAATRAACCCATTCSTPCRRWRSPGVLMTGGLSYPLLIAYGLVAGSIGAFAVPTRDALLPVVAKGGGLPRAVALATALQFVGQLLGIACASTADRFGAAAAAVRCMPRWCWLGARRVAAARSAAASAGRASELLAQHRRRHRRGRAVRADLAGAAAQFRHRRLLCRAVHGRAAARRARQLSRRRAELAYVNLAFWAGHHRRRLRLRRPGAAAHACAAAWSAARSRSAR